MGDLPISLTDVEGALRTVQRTLDRLTERGHHQAAFDLARAQYAASIRSSWPGNLAQLATHLEKLQADPALELPAGERAELERAIAVFREIRHG